MSDIDLATNLPKLPDGQYWVVSEESKAVFRQEFGYVYLAIVEMREITKPEKYRVLGFGPFTSRKKTRTQTVEKLKYEICIKKSHGIGSPRSDYAIKTSELTEVHIRSAAKELLSQIKDFEKAKSLLGSYPPKKLGD